MKQVSRRCLVVRLTLLLGTSISMMLGLLLVVAPLPTLAFPLQDRPGANFVATEPFTPTGHFQPVLTPTNEWNDEIPLVASPVLDNQGVIFASLQEIAVNQNKILRSTDGGRHWITISIPAFFYHAELALSPGFTNDHTVFGGFGSALYRSTDGGNQWIYVSIPPVSTIDLLRLSPDYINDHTLFIGSYGSGVYRSIDDGLSWTLITTDTAPYVTDLEVSPGFPADPTLFVSIYNDGIFRSDNGGITWTHLTAPQFSPDFRITLSPDFDTDNTVFVGANGISDGGAFRSNNRGESWTPIKDGRGTYLIVVSPNFGQDQTVVVGSDSEPPSISENAGNTWYPMSDLPGLGAYGRRLNLALAYEHGVLLPVASSNQTIYRYRWPSLGLSWLFAPLRPGVTDTVDISVPLTPDESVQTGWAAGTDAAWLSAAPITGTFPATVTLTIDPVQLTGTTWSFLHIDAQWSLRQTETITVPILAMFVNNRTWLPMLLR